MYAASPTYAGVNLRAKPTTDSAILDAMPYGAEVRAGDATVAGPDGEPWRWVVYGGQDGYALASLLSSERPPAAPTPTPSPAPSATPEITATPETISTPEPTSAEATPAFTSVPPTSRPTETSVPTETAPDEEFSGYVSVIDEETRARMQHSWRPGCPVPLEDLRLLSARYWGFDGDAHMGELVVHEDYAYDVLGALEELFDAGFPIERMRLVDVYGGDDDSSMAANNTSAFNCREVTGRPGVWSEHSYGRAIDINPVQNPYVTEGGLILPPAGEEYADRSEHAPGMVHRDGPVVDAFAAIGWGWGGDWSEPVDYQHFSATGR